MRFKDKVCLVVGGSTGIGAATMRGFVREGGKAAIASDLSLDATVAMRDELREAGAEARNYQCDISDPVAVSALIENVKSDFGRIDVAVNCAGYPGADGIFNSNSDVVRKSYEVNALGPHFFVAALARVMRAQGGGNIVLVASMSGIVGTTQISSYCASKAAVMQLVRGVVPELRGTGIRINAIAPGLVRSPMTAFLETPEGRPYLETISYTIPSAYGDPWLEPEDQAAAILFLASDAARAIQGHCLVTDQGTTTWLPTGAEDPRT